MQDNPSDSDWRLTTPALAWRRLLMAVLVAATAVAGVATFARLLAPGGIAPMEWMVCLLFTSDAADGAFRRGPVVASPHEISTSSL